MSSKLSLLVVFFLNSILVFGEVEFNYFSPVSNASFVSSETSIILRISERLDVSTLDNNSIQVVGSESGTHDLTIELIQNGHTVIAKLDVALLPCETVSLSTTDQILTTEGESVKPIGHWFTVSCRSDEFDALHGLVDEEEDEIESAGILKSLVVPANFPKVKVNVNTNPAPGYVFVTSTNANGKYLMILNNDGSPHYYEETIGFNASDFKKLTASKFGYAKGSEDKYYILDLQYAIVDEFMAGNGYAMDIHEFEIMPNGNALILIYDDQIVDMSAIVTGGQANATVKGIVIQEIDSLTKNVVWEWKSWDHFAITDNDEDDLTMNQVNPFHTNSIEYNNGNVYLSSKRLDEITKIDHATGNILWRMGGGQMNQFTLIGDTAWFCDNHDARVLPNGNITIFDNGTCHELSFAKEYEIDENAMTATLVWSYAHPEGMYSGNRGNAQRLSNGNTLISWGGGGTIADDAANVSEVESDGTLVYEMVIDSVDDNVSYRAFRFEWNGLGLPTSNKEQVMLPMKVIVYPSPGDGVFYIKVTDDENANVETTVFDELGRMVATVKVKGMYGEVDLTGHSPGIYFFQTSTKSGMVVNRVVLTD
ncbi:MAG: aryl-sulfate sulfotransferase [Flavobacteriales bacterium]|nr:aryl-sulfate sulfotransferase [Flavobacteriales bacterium]